MNRLSYSYAPETLMTMHLIAGLVVLAHAAVLLSAPFLLPGPDNAEMFLAITFGVTHAEIGLLAVWAVFSSRALGTRMLVSTAGILLVAAVFCTYVIRTNGPTEVCVISTISLFVQWAVTQVPFWLTKRSGWVVRPGDTGVHMDHQVSQFHIRHLFIWTTAIAVLFGIGNAASGLIGDTSKDFTEWVVFFGIVTISNVLMAGPLIWATLTRDSRLAWASVAVAAIVLLTPLELTFFRQLPVSARLQDNGVRFIVVISFVHAITLVSGLLTIRGYRWHLARAAAPADLTEPLPGP